MGEFLGALLAAVLEPLLAAVGYFLLSLVLYAVLFPLFYVLLTPCILVASLFGAGRYGEKVATYYRGVPGAVASAFVPGPW